jgi:CubicO group peptidase (beta-lactamase class C family)
MVTPVATKPEDLGIDSEKLEALFARAKRDVDDGTLPSASVAVARNGQLAGFRVFGNAVQGGEMRPATEETLYTIFSSTKAIVAAAVWTLFEDNLLRLDEKVADIIPEFASNGKDVVTVEQALLHIGGFPLAPLGHPAWTTREGRLAAFARWRLNWEPGSQFQYHATALHWVLMEIIERRTGIDGWTYTRDRIIEPAGLDQMYIGLPDELNSRVADVLHVTPPEPPPGGWGEVTPDAILAFNRPEVRAVGVPGGGGIARAAEIALFYQPLVNGGEVANGKRILKPETIEFATKVRTTDKHVDPLLGHPINRALAVCVAGDDGQKAMRGFGNTVSGRAFGHAGAGGQLAWGDPETGISLGYCTNGFVDVLSQGRRTTALASLAGSCLA